MPLSATDQRLLSEFSLLADTNPFLPTRLSLSQSILGAQFTPFSPVWHRRSTSSFDDPNIPLLLSTAEDLWKRVSHAMEQGDILSDQQRDCCEDLLCWILYHRHRAGFYKILRSGLDYSKPDSCGEHFALFARDAQVLFRDSWRGGSTLLHISLDHLYAIAFQLPRAFLAIYSHMYGGSLPAANQRGAVWQSIFSNQFRRYRRHLYTRLNDVPCLITGPSGSGKELVARAISAAGYIPFDSRKGCFSLRAESTFHPIHLASLSPTIIEAELFGHVRGAFTGATTDREGRLEICQPWGCVFLDEIGDVDVSIQVKLLRVLQDRKFQRVGDHANLTFSGRIIAATNRDLTAEITSGRFRSDFYYRLCADIIRTPSLIEQIRDAPEELDSLVRILADRIAGADAAPEVAKEVLDWIHGKIGLEYPWPGNVRELEQCVRGIMMHGSYHPIGHLVGTDWKDAFLAKVRAGSLTNDELLRGYATIVYDTSGSYEEAARIINVDWRTIRSRVDLTLLSNRK